jgi:deoxycytidine triphosphate deaminase
MLLSDHDLRAVADQMGFETEEHQRPFDLDQQIQPSSIDLRLDRCFWLGRKATFSCVLDLRKLAQGQVDMRRHFKTRWLHEGEGITIKPGQMILGRTFEKFGLPNGYVGKLEGRSTYARLGLSIHCTGDFINPGWRGRMPLQLVNHGAIPITIVPYMSICQLLVVRTSSPSDRPYGSENGNHKYMDDEGGPSKYWLDSSLAKLQKSFGQVPEAMQDQFIRALGRVDPEREDRFSSFLSTLEANKFTSAQEVMERFADRDTNRQAWAKRRLLFCRWFPFLPISASISALLRTPYGWIHFTLWIITGLLLPLGTWGLFFANEPSQPFTRRDVEDHFSANK